MAPTDKPWYLRRGKTHLIRVDPEMPPDLSDATWCGVKLEDCNHYTLEQSECTCQKCLLIKTSNWGGPRDRSKKAEAPKARRRKSRKS